MHHENDSGMYLQRCSWCLVTRFIDVSVGTCHQRRTLSEGDKCHSRLCKYMACFLSDACSRPEDRLGSSLAIIKLV